MKKGEVIDELIDLEDRIESIPEEKGIITLRQRVNNQRKIIEELESTITKLKRENSKFKKENEILRKQL